MSPTRSADVAEHPILFSGPLIRAILAGRKTQTRRLVSPKDIARAKCAADCTGPQPEQAWPDPGLGAGGYLKVPCAEGAAQRVRYRASIGDRLWVRESFRPTRFPGKACVGLRYLASPEHDGCLYALRMGESYLFPPDDGVADRRWPEGIVCRARPSIHMPRWASRISLEVTSVRVERLHAITEEAARAEGVTPFFERFPSIGRDQRLTTGELATQAEHRASFAVLWDELNDVRALWITNPWVWVVEFKRTEK